jgi:putative ABC transport system permease protein
MRIERSFDEHGTDLTVKRRGIAEPFGGTIPQELIPEIAKIPGVEDVAGQLITFAATENDDSVLAAGWSPDSFYWNNAPIKAGRIPSPDKSKVAMVGSDIARNPWQEGGR